MRAIKKLVLTALIAIPMTVGSEGRDIPTASALHDEFYDVAKVRIAEYSKQPSPINVFPHHDVPKKYSHKEIYNIFNELYSSLDMSRIAPKNYLMAKMAVESKNNPFAVSPVGASGLMQVMEDAWYETGEESDYQQERFNPFKNIRAGFKYYRKLYRYVENNYPGADTLDTDSLLTLTSAAYNGGLGKLESKNWEIESMSQETQKYVVKIKIEKQKIALGR